MRLNIDSYQFGKSERQNVVKQVIESQLESVWRFMFSHLKWELDHGIQQIWAI